MPADRKRAPTLELYDDDNDELMALCRDNGVTPDKPAYKKDIGSLLLRYAFERSEEILAAHRAASSERTRKRRGQGK